jgi:hypothetical protein
MAANAIAAMLWLGALLKVRQGRLQMAIVALPEPKCWYSSDAGLQMAVFSAWGAHALNVRRVPVLENRHFRRGLT